MALLPGVLTRNWTLKLASFGVALLLWVAVRAEAPNRQILPAVLVQVDLNDPEWALASPPLPASIEVRVVGPARELFSLALDRPVITVPVNRVGSGDTVLVLSREWLPTQGRPGVVVEGFEPSSIRLSFEPMWISPVALQLSTTGVLSEDLALSAPVTVDPLMARVSGPASRVESMTTLPLLPFDLARVDGPGRYRLDVDTTGLGGLTLSPSEVFALVQVEEAAQRTVSLLVQVPASPADGVIPEATPGSVSVTLHGASSLLDSADLSGLRVTVPPGTAEDLAPGEVRSVNVMVQGVPDLLSVAVSPDTVRVRRPSDR